ncbi:MAG: hypothetical protein Q7J35_11640 [Candidatus Methanoperedens sp.]|nr:hypothetical protein [Candidatus Methanoperedens sp.]
MVFENIITIFDKHEGSIIGIATVLLVVATLVLAYFNLKMWLAQDRPYLDFRIRHDEILENQFNFYIKNIGKGSAIDITFKIDNTIYSRKSLDSHEEILIETVESLEDTKKYINGIKNIKFKDINGFGKKQNSIKFVDMGKITTKDDRIQ